MLIAFLLLASPRYAFAQVENTALNPYINSRQLYRVPMGSIANDVVWEIADGLTITRGLNNITWADTARSAGNHEVEITFVDSVFTIGSSWTLTYSEYDIASSRCVAVRSFTINPVNNTFYLTVPDNDADCNELSETIIPNELILANPYNFSFPFDIHIHKTENFRITQWSCIGTFSVVGTGYTYANPLVTDLNLAGSTSRGYSWLISDVGVNSFKITISLTAAQTLENFTADTLTVYANFEGPPINDVNVILNLSDGEAQAGENYTKVTSDNASLGVDTYTGTFWGIPNTSIIYVTR